MTVSDGEVIATARDVVAPVGGLLGFLPAVSVQARAVTSAEGGR
jgi:hypothetical protein